MTADNYSPINESDTEQSECDTFLYESQIEGSVWLDWPWYWIAQGILLCISLSLFTASFANYQRVVVYNPPLDPPNVRELESAYEVASQKHIVQFRGNFYEPSECRGPPNAAVDAAWERIATGGVFSVSEEKMRQLGKLSDSSVRLPAEDGGGYLAVFEAYHQMHCLDLLRQHSYQEYYAVHSPSYAKHHTDPKKLRIHLDHCIEMLRQVIMCNSDMHVVTHDWVDHTTGAWPDFSVNHQCRDYEKLMSWIDGARLMTSDSDFRWTRPEGAATKHIILPE